MKIYNYDAITKEFLNESEAELSSLEENVYLIPANATDIKPLKAKSGFAICFINNEWVYKRDLRDKTFYHTKTQQSIVVDTLDFDDGEYTELEPFDDSFWDGKKWVKSPITKEKLIQEFKDRVQAHLDKEAQSHGYDNIVSACSYAGYENEFKEEGEAFGKWRAKVWKKWYIFLAEKGNQDPNTIKIDELLQDLPDLELPKESN
ncbi:hypothetical protein [Campylobacter pinnipediorum]|uniref:hypothetical protein n=1 Tax=Campylobacter pinnipediorum TaxID=1965231 RepID=UPI000994C8F9|nr:hypothetical protein [Campylobacter pinnipediorum]AQW81279.1 hypothetical protein CPIN17260_0985 [Campylobacter pinnipediorum subsp. pinnipediorum]AQW82905.1 hypothetical protein CPIN17261_0896 [Campylobacter pinnipediorum subsp. pinnipediorum]